MRLPNGWSLTEEGQFALVLTANDGSARSATWSFTAGDYLVLTPSMKVTDARNRGFVWRMFQNEGNTEALTQRAEDALLGKLKDGNGSLLPNLADPSVQGPASAPGVPAEPGSGVVTYRIPTVINVSQSEGTSFGTFTPDEQMPGTPGLNGSTDGISVEILTFLQLPRGLITMVVNSDDGFKTTAGFLKETPLILAEIGFGRGSADTIFQFAVQEAGVYAFRTVYFEAGGDADHAQQQQLGERARVGVLALDHERDEQGQKARLHPDAAVGPQRRRDRQRERAPGPRPGAGARIRPAP